MNFELVGRRCGTIILITTMLVLFMPGFCPAKYDYIDISNPFLRKIPIAVPHFKSMSASGNEQKISENGSQLLSETLEFTGFFKIMDHASFLEDTRKAGIIESQINFLNWTGIGAELLITGGILIKDGVIEIELRLFDTFKNRLLIGKRYKGQQADLRQIIRKFCGAVIYELTGKRGIFESKIAFESTGPGNKDIFICDFDGYNARQITHTKSITLSPAWSYDGKWIAYTDYKNGNPDLYIKHLTEKRGFVVALKGVNISPAWIPGKFALAATFSFSGDPEIYMLTGTGKIIKRLTRQWGIDVSPSFSPDGHKMAFVSQRSGTPQIYIKHLDNEQVERVTFEGQYNTTPSWSPAGDKIAYSSLGDGHFDIYVVNIKDKQPLRLTCEAGDNESPAWSPDGTLIVFGSTREGKARIYVMTSFGTDQRRLLALPGEQTNPKWSSNITNN